MNIIMRTEKLKIRRIGNISMKDVLKSANPPQTIIFACIGSSSVVGDSLGPRIGTLIKKELEKSLVFGTMQEPLNGLNIPEYRSFFKEYFSDCFIISIDACVANTEDKIGKIELSI